jgi:hypothetical protein
MGKIGLRVCVIMIAGTHPGFAGAPLVKLRGAWAAVTKGHADRFLRPTVRQMKRYGPFLRPVCLFLFTREDEGAWYTWVAEPAEEGGKPLLRSRDEPDCRPLDRRALNAILERVDAWHDVLFPSLVGNGPGGGKAHSERAKQ